MKNVLLTVAVVLLGMTTVFSQTIDTIVSKTPTNKNVVLEEYTGIYCGFCPVGHRIGNEIAQSHPGRVFLINIHAGTYANNTYTTQYGNSLVNQTNLDEYPSGTVNRHVFSGNTYTALNRGSWASCANTILNQVSPVNIAAWGTLDMSTRELHLTVQLYYTANSDNATNKLNVAVLQDNIIGPQSGSSYNPSQVVGSQYRHMHMLRDLITGQWGETISTTTAGTFVQKEYTYTVPQSLGSPNAVAAILNDLHFIVFVAEGNQEILTGVNADVQLTNQPAVGLTVTSLDNNDVTECKPYASTSFSVKNWGSDALQNVTLKYKVGSGEYQTYNWVGNIASGTDGVIMLPNITITPNVNQIIKASIVSANGVTVNSDESSVTVKEYIYSIDGPCHFILTTDAYASETSFKIFGPNGNVILQGGPFSNLQSSGTTVREYDFTPTEPGCYRLEVYDAYGDGINNGYGAGNFKLYKADGSTLIFSNNGKFGAKAVYKLIAFSALGVEDNEETMRIYPNPASTQINIESDSQVLRVELYNLQGQMVQAQSGDIHNVSLTGVSNGIYMLKVTTEKGTTVQKIVKQ